MSATTALAAGGRGLAWCVAGALWAAVIATRLGRWGLTAERLSR